jgi:holin-like protein
MRGFALLLVFQLAGAALHAVGVPVPGSVIGLLLLTAALFSGIVRLESVEPTANFLLKHMLLFFVPMTVLTMRLGPMLQANWRALAVIIAVSTVAVMLSTGLVAELLLAKEGPVQE